MNPARLAIFLLLLVRPSLCFSADPTPSEVRASFLKLLDRPKVPLDPRVGNINRTPSGLKAQRLSFATERKSDGTQERVPTLLIWREDSSRRRPAVIVLHGTGGNKEGSKDLLEGLADRGFLAVAIDGRYHGERVGVKGTVAYNHAIIRAWRAKPGEAQEHPFYYDTCWDVWRTIDYLQTRDNVDPDRIGLIGFSKGGIETYLAGAVDERVKVAIPAISVQSFNWGLEHDRWQARAKTIAAAHEAAASDLGETAVNPKVCRTLWDKVIPGMTGPYDGPSILRLFAGRPLLILNGSEDPNCPIEGARLAFAAAETAYREAGASDRLKIDVAEGVGHSVTAAQNKEAMAWFERWLKP